MFFTTRFLTGVTCGAAGPGAGGEGPQRETPHERGLGVPRASDSALDLAGPGWRAFGRGLRVISPSGSAGAAVQRCRLPALRPDAPAAAVCPADASGWRPGTAPESWRRCDP